MPLLPICVLLALTAGRVDPPAAAPPPLPAPLATATVRVQVPEKAGDPKFTELAESLPAAPVEVNPYTLQSVLSGAAPPNDTPLAAKVRAVYLQITPSFRAPNDPSWKDGIDPIIWLKLTRGSTQEWWRAFKATPAATRPLPPEMYPFVYDFGADSKPAARVTARQFNDDGIDAVFLDADLNKAADLLYKAVSADPTYPYGPYNAGVLQMCQQNWQPSFKKFTDFDKRRDAASPALRSLADTYYQNMKSMLFLQYTPGAEQRRIYAQNLGVAWALLNIGQYRAAALFAGQAAGVDPRGERPEAHLLAAMICGEQNQPDRTARWLQDAMERCEGAPYAAILALLRDIQQSGGGTAAAPVPTTGTPAPAAPTAPTAPAQNPTTPGS